MYRITNCAHQKKGDSGWNSTIIFYGHELLYLIYTEPVPFLPASCDHKMGKSPLEARRRLNG